MENSTSQNQRETTIIELPHEQVQVEIYSHMIVKEWFKFKEEEDCTEYALKNLIVKFGEETDKEKIYDLVSNIRLEDYTLIDKELAKLLAPVLAKKK